VVLSWTLVCLAAAVPLMLVEGLDFTQAFFESVSGWTTTGLSVVDVTRAHPATLLWRSAMQARRRRRSGHHHAGAITGAGGPSLSTAEGKGTSSPERSRFGRPGGPDLRRLRGAGSRRLRLAGMDWFDSVNHAFCAVSTGGFSTRLDSIGLLDSAQVELVTAALMILGKPTSSAVWCAIRFKLRAVARTAKSGSRQRSSPVIAALMFALTCLPCTDRSRRPGRVGILRDGFGH